MRRIRAFGRFWYDFVVGDDWRLACGGASALGATAGIAHSGVPAWWVTPVVVVAALMLALRPGTTR
jgi:hypothetical protein